MNKEGWLELGNVSWKSNGWRKVRIVVVVGGRKMDQEKRRGVVYVSRRWQINIPLP